MCSSLCVCQDRTHCFHLVAKWTMRTEWNSKERERETLRTNGMENLSSCAVSQKRVIRLWRKNKQSSDNNWVYYLHEGVQQLVALTRHPNHGSTESTTDWQVRNVPILQISIHEVFWLVHHQVQCSLRHPLTFGHWNYSSMECIHQCTTSEYSKSRFFVISFFLIVLYGIQAPRKHNRARRIPEEFPLIRWYLCNRSKCYPSTNQSIFFSGRVSDKSDIE